MPVDKWEGQLISAEEFDQLEDLYRPLAQAVRELIDATVRTGADEETIQAAAGAIRVVTETLKPLNHHGWQAIRHADTGRPILFTNPAAGGRNPIAPPMVSVLIVAVSLESRVTAPALVTVEPSM